MESAINLVSDLFGLNERRAQLVYLEYFRDFSEQRIKDFYKFYVKVCNQNNIYGDVLFKISSAFEFAELEFKKRFEDKVEFINWLKKNYKGRLFFKINENDFTYEYYAYDGFGKAFKMEQACNEMLVSLNQFGEFCYKDGELIENCEFKEALIEYIFKNQHRIGKDLTLSYKPQISLNNSLGYEERYNEFKREQNKLCNENKDKFILIIKHALKNKI
ncbi:hypothetical protein [Campylobacter sp. CCS1377]|uniref:Uncharacterized protein n=1 Tax=Campylobacter sp. CCS1377 TaxID=3158229 RepID=A0AAU7E4K1_9BACT